MAKITKITKRIAIESLRWNDNPRTEKTLLLDKMVASFVQHGYQHDSTIMVEDCGGDNYLVLRGNRRSLAAKQLQSTKPDQFAEVFPDGKIPAIVVKGISDQERILMRIDHSDELDRVPLDDEGLFNAVLQLAMAGLTQVESARHLNLWIKDKSTKKLIPNRSLVQQRVNLAKLPKFVQDEFRKLMRDGTGETAVRWSQVAKLYKLYNPTSITHPDGTIEFNEFWEKCKTPASKAVNSGTGKALSPSKAKELGQLCQSKLAARLLYACTEQGNETLTNIDLEILDGEMALQAARSPDPEELAELAEASGLTESGELV